MPYRITEQGEQRRSARRAQLVDAATRLFATQGYAATTMQQVVQAANTSIGNCYFYFPNKEALLRAVVEQVNEEIGQAVDDALAVAPAGPGQLAIALYTGTQAFAERRNVARVALIEAAYVGLRPLATAHFTQRIERFFALHPELMGGLDPHLAARAWEGAALSAVETLLADEQRDPDAVGLFLARWNLQALGLSAQVVDRALNQLDTFIAQGKRP